MGVSNADCNPDLIYEECDLKRSNIDRVINGGLLELHSAWQEITIQAVKNSFH